MSYYWFNREKILKNGRDKHHNKGGKKRLLSIIKTIYKFNKKMQEISIEICQKKKKKKEEIS